jgi:fructoselysine/glucoselysine PTS system EIID component
MLTAYILLALVAVLGHCEDFLGTTLIGRPLVLCPLVGLILGDVSQGIIIGATLELIFMGNIKVGAAIPPDVITGGVLGGAFALLSHKGAAIALTLAIPISILAEMLLSLLFISRSALGTRFAAYASAGDYRGIARLHVLSGLLKPLLMGGLVFLSLLLGAGPLSAFLGHLPPWVSTGLQVAGNMLPALGFALLMNLMFRKNVAPYFFLGFILAAFLHLPVIAIGGIGVIIAVLVTNGTVPGLPGAPATSGPAGHAGPTGPAGPDPDFDEDFPDAMVGSPTSSGPLAEGAVASGALAAESALASGGYPGGSLISRGVLRRVFWRSLTLEANFNFETWQNTGYAFAMIPVLKRLYKTRESMAKALQRHLQFFNTSPYGSTLIMGISTAMEEQCSKDPDFDPESISAVKAGLMGPLAGVFDSLFWGTLKVIAAGVGTSLALKGNILGPVLFLLIFNLPHLLLRYQLTFQGYQAGTRILQKLAGNQVMDKLTLGASILGLMVVGAMPATLMSIRIPIDIGPSGSALSLQGILDQVVPAVVPMGLTFGVYYLVKRNVKTTYLLVGLMALGFVGSMIHLFA